MTDFLLPVDDDELTQPFWEGCAQGELRMQRFTASGRYCWPPPSLSPTAHFPTFATHPVTDLSTCDRFKPTCDKVKPRRHPRSAARWPSAAAAPARPRSRHGRVSLAPPAAAHRYG